jgi:hypothetical protein
VVAECDPRQFYGGLQRSRGGISVRDLTRLGVTTKQAAVAEATGCGGSGGLAAGASAGIEPGASGASHIAGLCPLQTAPSRKCHTSTTRRWLDLCITRNKREIAMKRDIGVMSGAILAIGAVVWAFWGNPDASNRTNVTRKLDVAPELKLVSERSPYMRTER